MDNHKSRLAIELFYLICKIILVKSNLTLEEIRMEINIELSPKKNGRVGFRD